MNKKLFLLQVPIILIFTFAFLVAEMGTQGRLDNAFLRARVYPVVSRVTAFFTDAKFKIRGPQAPKSKVVVVEVDSPSIETIGRWPWHRDATAYLIDKTFEAGAKAVGLDIVFSETDKRVPDEVAGLLRKQKMEKFIAQFETDPQLAGVIARHKDKLVLGWTTESECQPLYEAADDCPAMRPEVIATHPKGFEKFSYGKFISPPGFDGSKTPFKSLLTFIANIEDFNAVATHSAYLNGHQDPDGYIRRHNLFMMAGGVPYPSMAAEMSRIAKNDTLKLQLNEHHRVQSLGWEHGREVHVTPLGAMEINFRGPARTFPYISALEIMNDSDTIQNAAERHLASASKKELLKDAYVLIGLSAIGVFDMRAWPYESNGPGVEIHANILDNLLAGDELRPGSGGLGSLTILFLMIIGAIAFGAATNRLEAVPALFMFLGVFLAMSFLDVRVLFKNNLNWN
ncbi:MAG: CHASE2 domain-containing protein, partial [Bdellovibrionota bacterium]